jgi:hypothetical protein
LFPALKLWDSRKGADQPELIFISQGTIEANQAIRLRSKVLLDPNFSTARLFGVPGTPSAVIVDADGKIASPLAIGSGGVLKLAGYRPATLQQ